MSKLKLKQGTRNAAVARTYKSHEEIVRDILSLVDPPVSKSSWDRVESTGVRPSIMGKILEAFRIYANEQGDVPAVIEANIVAKQVDDGSSNEPEISIASEHVEVEHTENMIPFRQNPFFSGRTEQLQHLHFLLTCDEPRIVALSGLGGIGKTQVAVEYAHTYGHLFSQVLWSRADSSSVIKTGYRHIAEFLKCPVDITLQRDSVEATRQWLVSHDNWLLILDNADTPQEIEQFIPSRVRGRVLLTSRDQNFDCLGVTGRLFLREFSDDETLGFVSRRLQRNYFDENDHNAILELNRELGGLPLALEQAVAYVANRRISRIADYVQEFRIQRLNLLKRQGPQVGNYGESVATTWLLNFRQVREISQAAADLLKFTAFLADSSPIPYSYIIKSTSILPDSLRELLEQSHVKSVGVAEALAPLAKFSLVNIDAEQQTYSVHLVVQEIVRDLNA